jgi:hypothetical protein
MLRLLPLSQREVAGRLDVILPWEENGASGCSGDLVP